MQWPYCHGYGAVGNINQACTCNKEKWDGGQRGKTAMRETEGGNRGRGDNDTASICFGCMYFNEQSCNCSCLTWKYCSISGKLLFRRLEFSLLCWLYLNVSWWAFALNLEVNSVLFSYQAGVNSLFSSQRFTLAADLHLNVIFFFFWQRNKTMYINNPSHSHKSINNSTCKCLPHENEMFSSIIVFFSLLGYTYTWFKINPLKNSASLMLESHGKKNYDNHFQSYSIKMFLSVTFPCTLQKGKVKDCSVWWSCSVFARCLQGLSRKQSFWNSPAEQNVK